MKKFLIPMILLLLAACTTANASVTNTPTMASVSTIAPSPLAPQPSPSAPSPLAPTLTAPPSTLHTPPPSTIHIPSPSTPQPSPIGPSATPRTPPPPDAWMTAPITPTISETARQIFVQGQALGRDPHAFSKVGDCQSITTYFLANFDTPGLYRLGSYSDLQATIDWFPGSFARESLSVKGGLNAAAMLSPFRADPKQCQAGETPLACEYRLHNPSIAIISLEEWWEGAPEKYEIYMRQIIEYTIQQGIVPILGTKADNLEGDHFINATIYRLAWEYDIPLWNFWASVQHLTTHGLVDDGFHLTHVNNFYFDKRTRSGWTMRNLTALVALDAVQKALNK